MKPTCMARLLGILFLLASCLVSQPAQADEVGDFLAQHGISNSQAATKLSGHALAGIKTVGDFKSAQGKLGQFFKNNQKTLKKAKWELFGDAIDVIGTFFTQGLEAATIKLAGALADALVEYGIPLLAGGLCAVFATPVAGQICFNLAKQLIAITDFDDFVEEKVENWVREQFARRKRQPHHDQGAGTISPPPAEETYNGDINLKVNAQSVTTTATDSATAQSEVGVARGGDVDITVSTQGNVSTTASGESSAYSGIGVAEQNGADIQVGIKGDISTSAKGKSDAAARVGVSYGRNSKISVNVSRDVNTVASGHSTADTNIGVTTGRSSSAVVNVKDDVNTIARGSASASTDIGIANGGRVNAYVHGVNTIASGTGDASNQIGISSGGQVNVHVGGDVTTVAAGSGSSSTHIGVNSSVSVGGDVINKDGDLSIGGSCAAQRDGKCCIEIHRQLCVLFKVPPDNKGRCPPRFERWGGWCYRYSDKSHQISR